MEEKIIVKGTPKKNSIAVLLIAGGIALLLVSLLVAYLVFDNVEAFKDFGYGYTGWYPYDILYDYDFMKFFSEQFFNFSCAYGYLFLLSLAGIITGFILKLRTESCTLTVTDRRIYGQLAQDEEVSILPSQVLDVRKCSFDGIAVNTQAGMKSFYCFENRAELLNAIVSLLSGSHRTNHQNSENETEKLMKLKQLFDSNIISQEEFDRKKKEIMGI